MKALSNSLSSMLILACTSSLAFATRLRVNQSVHAPLLCDVGVMDIASGDLSLPGKVNQ